MAEYTHEFSKFPSEIMARHEFRDVTDDVAPIINQINYLRSQGLYGQAAKLIAENANLLNHYSIDSTTFNTWFEELRNTQIYAKKVQQVIYTDDLEPDCDEDDIWIGGT